MGQVALGFRSLLVRAAVFFIMAALLAWALGGTLWPRSVGVFVDTASFQGEDWAWQAMVDESPKPSGKPTRPPLEFQLWVRTKGSDSYEKFLPFSEAGTFIEMLPLIVDDDQLIVAGYHYNMEKWQIYRINAGKELGKPVSYPSRLEIVEAWSSLAGSKSP
ncbi:MAG: hypothetical protein P8J89_09760 [Phycisphaerales bacterium]|nr:hypothetical protein [Phycisphaerales bacterium]|tara:strand:+ start:6083 stop:6565 length:483 start_codon:yes stop_codon:yes gene_type:complete